LRGLGALEGGALPGLIGSPVQLPRCGVGSVFLDSFRSVFTKQEIRVRVTIFLYDALHLHWGVPEAELRKIGGFIDGY
jgi:hypothetical protein